MLQIPCPWCGQRDEVEFTFGGEVNIIRPDPVCLTDEEWADYLFNRHNHKGCHSERWCHSYGCGRWFKLDRDTVTHRILGVYEMGAAAPGKEEVRS